MQTGAAKQTVLGNDVRLLVFDFYGLNGANLNAFVAVLQLAFLRPIMFIGSPPPTPWFQKIPRGFGRNGAYLAADPYANAVLASAHAESSAQVDFFFETVSGYQLFKNADNLSRTLEVAGGTYANRDVHNFHRALPFCSVQLVIFLTSDAKVTI